MRGSRWWLAAAMAMILLALPAAMQALINVHFTPIHLVSQADLILKVTLKPGDKPLTLTAEVVKAYKPKDNAPKGPIVIDLTTSAFKEQAEKVAKMVAAHPNEPAMLFAAQFKEEVEAGGGNGDKIPEALLHFAGQWVSLSKAKEGGGYEMDKIDSHLQGTWAGSTDMLARCVEYIQSDPSATVPVDGESAWDSQKQIGKVTGKAAAAIPVEIGAGLKQYLFVAADGGDKLFLYDDAKKDMADVTGKLKLASKSRQAVWGDFDGDGKIDLASWDGKALTLHLQQADGTFAAKPVDIGDALKDGCIGLAVVDSGKNGRAAILASTAGWPVLFVPGDGGKWSATVLGAGSDGKPTTQPAGPDKGRATPCLVADFDGDGLPDILQICADGGLIYKGKSPGQFEKPVPCPVALGEGAGKAWLGDYAGDGLLDVFTVAEDRCRLWHNLGQFKFAELVGQSGEIAYISKPGGIDGMTCDFNNDGRQDILIVYKDGTAPMLFFNRGFRSFGHAHAPVDIQEANLLPEAEKGAQAGGMGDFRGTGAQDMALVLNNGEVWMLYQKALADEPVLSVRVALPLKGAAAGPVTVTATTDKQPLGAWNLVAGLQTGFFARRTAGPITLKYQLPGEKPQTMKVVLVDKPLRVVLGDPADKPAPK